MSERSTAATEQVQGRRAELVLIVTHSLDGFEVYRKLFDPEQSFKDSVFTIDYSYTPWQRCSGNLLW